jgi:hypothetical protein
MARVFANELLIFMMVFVFVMFRLTRLFSPARRNTTQLPARRLDWLPMSSAPFRLKRGKSFEVFVLKFFCADNNSCVDYSRFSPLAGLVNPAN